jgi:hypothetical protein
MLVVVFGLYHGLIFLPAVLSLIGPKPYTQEQLGNTDEDEGPTKPHSNMSSVANVELKKVTQIKLTQ